MTRFERFCLHDQFEQKTSGSKNVNGLWTVLSLFVCYRRGVALHRPHGIADLVGDGLIKFICRVPGGTEVHQFQVELAVEEDVFALYVAVSDVPAVQMPQGGKELAENGSSCFF